MLSERIDEIQVALRDAGVDGWLFACFQNNDPVSLELLGLIGDHLVTRRCYYLVPAEGEPRKLVHRLEPAMLDGLPGQTSSYLRWQEHSEAIAELLRGMQRLAAQYSPGNQLPTVSRLDAGTAELLRGHGVELVSAADLIQQFAATWIGGIPLPVRACAGDRGGRGLHRAPRAPRECGRQTSRRLVGGASSQVPPS